MLEEAPNASNSRGERSGRISSIVGATQSDYKKLGISGVKRENLTEVAFSGIHIIDPAIFGYMEEGVYTMTSLYLKIASKEKILTLKNNSGYWVDIGTAEKLEYCRKLNLR